jgi:putative DNA-invertase from lambdoid prophage Rac
VDRLEAGDVLVVTKLDRLGRDTIDVVSTVDRLAKLGVRVHCLALGGADLTSAAGRMIMTVLAALAAGQTISEIARRHGVSRKTVMRCRGTG